MEFFSNSDMLLTLLVLYIVVLIPYIFFLLSQQNTLLAVEEQNELEHRNRISRLGIWEDGLVDEVNIHPTFTTGQWYCILVCITAIPFIGFITFIFALILWISYWNQLIKYRKMISM